MGSEPQQEIWGIDTEWGYSDGRIDEESAFVPVVLCAVGLHSGQRHSFWRQTPQLSEFFADHADDLFVSHYATAEMGYLQRLNIPAPARWFDTFSAFRRMANTPGSLDAGLSFALHQLGSPHLAPAEKKELQERIVSLRFDFDNPADQQRIVDYCFTDCDGTLALYERLRDSIDPQLMAVWVEYLKAVARMELRGIPIDRETYSKIGRLRHSIREELATAVNSIHEVFFDGALSRKALIAWAASEGIVWPVRSGPRAGKRLQSIDDETLKSLEALHPFIGQVRQVNKTLKHLSTRSLTVDSQTSRHHFSTSVFRSVTGRNQPQGFIFSAPKWMRFLIVPESPEHVLVHVDYVAQEVGIAAALSGDRTLSETYSATDCHMEFAIRASAAPGGATKQTHARIRKAYKAVNLGVLYGQTAFGIAPCLGISQQAAQSLLDEHHRLFPDFWDWSEQMVQAAFDRGRITTPCGWTSRVPFASNPRTWRNFPIQSTGGDIMRLTVIYLDRQNVRLLAPIHDGFLLSCRRDQLPELNEAISFAFGTAVEQVLPGFPLRWETTVYDQGRFEDEDGAEVWGKVRRLLEAHP